MLGEHRCASIGLETQHAIGLGGIGAFHFIVTLALVAVYSQSRTSGMVFAIISHESQAVTMLLTGLFAVIFLSVTKKNKPKQVQ